MGAYVNPEGMTKEEWLEKHGKRVPSAPVFSQIPDDKLLVVLVENPAFSAAGICFDRTEYGIMTSPTEKRPRTYYLVNRRLLFENSNLGAYQSEDSA